MNLLQFLQDGAGANSNMRALVALVVAGIIGTWIVANVAMAYNAIFHGGAVAIVPMDTNMIWAIGVALGAKTAQAAVETKAGKQ